ncbi:MAG TPA: plastocyanin/azurin family copper-binding protein [Solirubrobacteraceae bacterium]
MRLHLSARAAPLLAAASGLVLLAGCGSSNSYSSTPAPTNPAPATTAPVATSSATAHALTVTASPDGSLMFNTTSLTTTAGHVTIAFTNMASVGHNLTVASSSGAVLGATPTFSGATKTLSLDLKAGKYTFYCSVAGHQMAGMQGTLTVTA